jgi:hypothetical protein
MLSIFVCKVFCFTVQRFCRLKAEIDKDFFIYLGGNVLCLDAWRGFDSGPFLHSIHFTFGIGAFIAPVIAEPFLK